MVKRVFGDFGEIPVELLRCKLRDDAIVTLVAETSRSLVHSEGKYGLNDSLAEENSKVQPIHSEDPV